MELEIIRSELKAQAFDLLGLSLSARPSFNLVRGWSLNKEVRADLKASFGGQSETQETLDKIKKLQSAKGNTAPTLLSSKSMKLKKSFATSKVSMILKALEFEIPTLTKAQVKHIRRTEAHSKRLSFL